MNVYAIVVELEPSAGTPQVSALVTIYGNTNTGKTFYQQISIGRLGLGPTSFVHFFTNQTAPPSPLSFPIGIISGGDVRVDCAGHRIKIHTIPYSGPMFQKFLNMVIKEGHGTCALSTSEIYHIGNNVKLNPLFASQLRDIASQASDGIFQSESEEDSTLLVVI